MKRIILLLAMLVLSSSLSFGQKKYEMVIEKTDGTELVFNTEDVVRSYFRERNQNHGYTSCPDSNHPHLIDLGLPSGTKWACCNVGAYSPDQYGGYYAWGETEEKDFYANSTYKYYQNGEYVDIGSDISGTEYDVAHVKWGDKWCMPTKIECQELIDLCDSEDLTITGHNGRKFIGPNGNSIFLPSAGSMFYSSNYRVGEHGNYWSSSHDDSFSGVFLIINYKPKARRFAPYHTSSSSPVDGCSVRPVVRY